MPEGASPDPHLFPFRPWVRNTCRNAMVWGIGIVALLGGMTWVLSEPGSEPVFRAFGSLVLYGLLFLASLAKIWWTAGGPAVVLEPDAIAYQPLHTFRPRRIPLADVFSCAPKEETHSLRFVYEASPGRGREFFLNLAVIRGRNDFLALLGDDLERRGLVPIEGQRASWKRPDWVEE